LVCVILRVVIFVARVVRRWARLHAFILSRAVPKLKFKLASHVLADALADEARRNYDSVTLVDGKEQT
jgi:hypothetical protein